MDFSQLYFLGILWTDLCRNGCLFISKKRYLVFIYVDSSRFMNNIDLRFCFAPIDETFSPGREIEMLVFGMHAEIIQKNFELMNNLSILLMNNVVGMPSWTLSTDSD